MAGSNPKFQPWYSHGGPNFPNWTGVAGTTNSSGLPIMIGGSSPVSWAWPCIFVKCEGGGGSATVFIEVNGGALDSTGNPPTNDWLDITGGGVAMSTAGTNKICKTLEPTMPFVRTRITSIAGGATITSYVPLLYVQSQSGVYQVVSASYPPITSGVPTQGV